jgi:UDP-3-O-acyl-N-acetylglucosamine deacetylase
MGVTDVMVEVSGPEIPIGDGSALPFVEMIKTAGVVEVGATSRPTARVMEAIVIEDGATRIEAHPTERAGLELTYRLEYPAGSPIPAQEASIFVPLGLPAEGYAEEIAPARTFCLQAEAEAMRKMGMFGHLTPKEMLVIGADGPIDNAYRFADEPARHKLLDLLGDLALCGRPVVGRVIATRTGHSHNHAMAAKLAGLVDGSIGG